MKCYSISSQKTSGDFVADTSVSRTHAYVHPRVLALLRRFGSPPDALEYAYRGHPPRVPPAPSHSDVRVQLPRRAGTDQDPSPSARIWMGTQRGERKPSPPNSLALRGVHNSRIRRWRVKTSTHQTGVTVATHPQLIVRLPRPRRSPLPHSLSSPAPTPASPVHLIASPRRG
jgi:hypothetical protein